MLRDKKLLPILLIALLALSLGISACAPSAAEKLNKEGNDAFTKQAFQEALVAYERAQIEEPELAEPYYNAANALYRQGAYDAALEQMQKALSFAGQESLAQAGYYNQGNTAYNRQDLETAVASYTQSLLIDPDDQDAKYNLELALQQLQQQQNEEQQQDQQQEDQPQEGEGQQEQPQDQNGEQQQDQAEQNQGEDQSEQNSGQEEEQPAETQEGQESEEGQEGNQAQEEQQDQGQQGEQQQEEQSQQGQGQPQEGQPDGNQEGQLNQLPAPGQRMTEEQAKQLLAAIARDGQTLQEKLGQIFAVPWVPPVQDW
jgi:Ca-activated chloride channel family protein